MTNNIFNLTQLEEFAQNLSYKINISNLILLKGELGSGKTTLSRYLIKHIYLLNKIEPPKIVPSPSFTILQSYYIKNFTIHHFDFFRIKDIKELIEIGFEECINGNIVIIEWPEIVMPMISKLNKIEIELLIVSKSTRKIIFY